MAFENLGGFEDRPQPKFVQLKEGDSVEGILVAVQRVKLDGIKPAIRYIVQDADGALVCFLGTSQINQVLSERDIRKAIRVRCVGTDPNVVRNGNAMKLMDVGVSKQYSDAPLPFISEASDGEAVPF